MAYQVSVMPPVMANPPMPTSMMTPMYPPLPASSQIGFNPQLSTPASLYSPTTWLPCHNGSIPHGAFVAGRTNYNSDLYVGRAYHEYDLLPGEVNPTYRHCTVTWGGKAHTKSHFEVLCGTNLAWVPSSRGSIPTSAVPGGNTSSGESLYIGRVVHNGIQTIGKSWQADVKILDPGGITDKLGRSSARWVRADNGSVPSGAFVGGRDLDCDLYIGRVRYGNGIIPGKVNPRHGNCYIPWGGKEIPFKEYEVLCGENFEWVSNVGGNIPPRAVPASNAGEGEVMYIGRIYHGNTRTIGKVHPSHGVCYIPYGGQELSFSNYEILVTCPVSYPAFKQDVKHESWLLASQGNIPPGCFIGGHDHDSELYVGRAYHNGDLVPGKLNCLHGVCYIPWGGKEIQVGNCEVLIGEHLEWICSQGSRIPEDAVHGGRTRIGEVLYIGRVHHNGTRTVGKIQASHGVCSIPYDGNELNFANYEVLVKRNTCNNIIFESTDEKSIIPSVNWVETRCGSVPSMAFPGGQSSGYSFYVGRVKHGDEIIPGKVHGDCFYSCHGFEHRNDVYQVLCGRNLSWASTSGNKIPKNAVHGGRMGNGEVLFIGRVNHFWNLAIGKVHPSHGACYIPYGGKEIAFQNYEILISNP